MGRRPRSRFLGRDGENRAVRLAEARDQVSLGLERVALVRGELLDREVEGQAAAR